ncbi:hypothetical protein GCM10020295_04760 [Streptomyces cinereospinus]
MSAATVDLVLRPLLSGVFLEDRLATSARFFHLVWRSMVRGTLCLPAAGVGAVPAQLAAGLPDGVLRLETPVREVTPPPGCSSTTAVSCRPRPSWWPPTPPRRPACCPDCRYRTAVPSPPTTTRPHGHRWRNRRWWWTAPAPS